MFSRIYRILKKRFFFGMLHPAKKLSCVVILLLTLPAASWTFIDFRTEPYELKYPANFGGRTNIPDGNALTKEGVYLGRMLFYEEKLSANNTISCSSCHQQKFAFSDPRPFSQGVDGAFTTRNSMSLANLLWVRNFFWDGRASSLEEQSIVPLTDPHEMGQSLELSSKKLNETKQYPALFAAAFGSAEISGERIVKALAQFERTLISANAPYDQYLRGEFTPDASALNGMKLFSTPPRPDQQIRGANCAHCHGTPKMFIELFHNNGIDSVYRDKGREAITGQSLDLGRFRVPTLRNIALTAPYMHDGRFNTLREVLDHYSDHVKSSETLSSFIEGVSNDPSGKTLRLTENEKNDIIAFLHLLTDRDFISNPAFADPETTSIKKK